MRRWHPRRAQGPLTICIHPTAQQRRTTNPTSRRFGRAIQPNQHARALANRRHRLARRDNPGPRDDSQDTQRENVEACAARAC